MIETSAVLAAISSNPWTAIILSHDGQIVEVVPLSAELTADTFLHFARTRAKGRRFRLVPQRTLDGGELDRIVADLVRPNEPARFWKAEPSVLTEKHLGLPLGASGELRAIAELIGSLFAKRLP